MDSIIVLDIPCTHPIWLPRMSAITVLWRPNATSAPTAQLKTSGKKSLPCLNGAPLYCVPAIGVGSKVPPRMLLPLNCHPKSKCGEKTMLLLNGLLYSDTATNGFTLVVPVPRKFVSSPVGKRTSAPTAATIPGVLNTVPFTRSSRSPNPVLLELAWPMSGRVNVGVPGVKVFTHQQVEPSVPNPFPA